MSAIEAVKAELTQKRDELATLVTEHQATIDAGRNARWVVEMAARKVQKLERALHALEGDDA